METNDITGNNSMQLISIDSSQNLQYYEKCKLEIDKITKHLIVKLSDKETDFIFISFKRTFLNVLQYILCADKCESDSHKYLIIFPTFEKFASVIEKINQRKMKFKLYISVIKNDQLFQREFLIQILYQCQQNEELEENLKAILSKLLEFYKPNEQQNNGFEGDKKIAAIENNENVCEIGDNDSDKCDNNQISVIMEDESENIFVAENVLQDAVEDIDMGSRENARLPTTADFSEIPKDVIEINVLQGAVEDMEEGRSGVNVGLQTASEIPEDAMEENVLQGAVEDMEEGSEENVEPESAMYSSVIQKDAVEENVLLGNCTNTGSLLNNPNGFNGERLRRRLKRSCREKKICEQICCNKISEPKPKKQKSNNFIYAPNFIFKHFIRNGLSRSRLFIFPTADKKQCYEYFYDFYRKAYVCCGCNNKKTCISAKIENGKEDFVECLRIDHICKLRPFKLDKCKSDLIIKAPNYQQITEIIDGEIKKFLLLFTSTDKKNYFKFSWDHGQQIYKCMECECAMAKKRIYIKALIRQDHDGNEFVYIRNQQQICSKMKDLCLKFDDNQSLTNANQKFKAPVAVGKMFFIQKK